MKIFLDSNVLIAGSIEQHQHFDRASKLLASVLSDKNKVFISAHSILEFHSTITKLPAGLAVTPYAAYQILNQPLFKKFKAITLSQAEYLELQFDAAQKNLSGGIIYDLLHLKCALKAEVERVYTFNFKHFSKLWPATSNNSKSKTTLLEP